jgi:ABC-type phosphate transport system substrate-binding protein
VGAPPARLFDPEVLALSRTLLSTLSFAIVLAFALPAAGPAVAEPSFRVIVHPEVKGSQIPRAALSSIFLKQAPKWGDGSRVLPVDQSVRSPIRQSFSNDVLRQGLVEVQVYWQRKMSTGVTPPPVKPTDEEVVAYVASTPGSIGYVSAGAPLPDSVKAVAVTD